MLQFRSQCQKLCVLKSRIPEVHNTLVLYPVKVLGNVQIQIALKIKYLSKRQIPVERLQQLIVDLLQVKQGQFADKVCVIVSLDELQVHLLYPRSQR